MISLAKNQNQTSPAKDICLTGELSGAAENGFAPQGESVGFGDEVIRLMCLKPTDDAQIKAAQRVEVSLRYMMRHLNQPMRVRMLSAMAGLSESSFFALFKSATGLTPLDFFIRARMRRAGELLEETSLQIKEVAARLGYDDQFYFSRLFKSVHGIPPREYRIRKEESNHQNRKRQPASGKIPAEYWPSQQPRLVPAGENQISERGLIGRFQPAAPRAKVFQARCCESSSPPDQTNPFQITQQPNKSINQ